MSYNNNTLLDLSVSQKLKDDFRTTATWAKIIAIVSFINAALSLVAAFKAGNVAGSIVSVLITVLLNVYLLNYGRKIQAALESTDQGVFIEGVDNLRMYFKIYGIIIIVALILCLLFMLVFGSTILSNL